MTEVLRVGNCSGFYGDRLSAMREMLEGARAGGLDVLTGDYLAELTMLILGKDQLKDPRWATRAPSSRQVEDCLGARARAGRQDRRPTPAASTLPAWPRSSPRSPPGWASTPRIAWVDGDDLSPRAAELGLGGALTANAYLGALRDRPRPGRRAPTSWSPAGSPTPRSSSGRRSGGTAGRPEQYDELAGAVVAGPRDRVRHPGHRRQLLRLPRPAPRRPAARLPDRRDRRRRQLRDHQAPRHRRPGLGRHRDRAADVRGAVRALPRPRRHRRPDHDRARRSEGPDRVRVSGVRGLAPPAQLKVCVNELGGFRNQMEFVLTGLRRRGEGRVAARAARRPDRGRLGHLVDRRGPRRPTPTPRRGPPACCAAWSRTTSADAVGKAFTSAAVELALGSYPGFTMTTPPGPASPYGVYRPAYVDRDAVTHTVHLPDGSTEVIPDPPVAGQQPPDRRPPRRRDPIAGVPEEAITRRIPLGTFVHARSGDKGGDANVGLWVAPATARRERARQWLSHFISVDRVRRARAGGRGPRDRGLRRCPTCTASTS